MAEDTQPSAREEQARRLAETLRRQLGATLCGLMQAPDVVELILNPDGRVWVDRLGQGMSSVCTMAPATAESLIATGRLFDYPLPVVPAVSPPWPMWRGDVAHDGDSP